MGEKACGRVGVWENGRKEMSQFTLVIGNKNYSSWSLRADRTWGVIASRLLLAAKQSLISDKFDGFNITSCLRKHRRHVEAEGLVKPHHDVHILNGLAGCAFNQVVEDGDYDRSLVLWICPHPDIAEV